METVLATSDLPRQLAAALRSGRSGAAGRSRMAPELSYGRHSGPAPHTARAAAVMLLLFQRSGCWHVPLTERPVTLLRHGGQISLPGGALEPGETTSQAAVRELNEELGVSSDVELLGRLADCYVYASDFVVTPWVALAAFEPNWKPHDREVQAVVEMPLLTLLDPNAVGQITVERGPLRFNAPCYRVGSATVWGATSVILGELAEVLRSIGEQVNRTAE